MLGENILIVPKSMLKDGVSDEDLDDTVVNAAIDAVTRTYRDYCWSFGREGIRVVDESNSAEEEESIGKVKRTKELGKDTHTRRSCIISLGDN